VTPSDRRRPNLVGSIADFPVEFQRAPVGPPRLPRAPDLIVELGTDRGGFTFLDRYVTGRLVRLLPRRHHTGHGRARRCCFRLKEWPHVRFVRDFGLDLLLGTIRYPGATIEV
jgi:hypothetical protein